MSIRQQTIEHSLTINASAETVWEYITAVDIASFRHPLYLSLLGIPKPLRAELVKPCLGGARIAYFSNHRLSSQKITLRGIKANAERQERTLNKAVGAPNA